MGPLPQKEGPEPRTLSICPTSVRPEVIRYLSCRNLVSNRRNFLGERTESVVDCRRKGMTEHGRQEDKDEIRFGNVGSPEFFEKKRMALQEPDDRIDQVGEQNRNHKNNNYSPRDIDDGNDEREHKSRD